MAIGQGAIGEAQAFGASLARTANVTSGTLVFTCFWTPLTADGYVGGV